MMPLRLGVALSVLFILVLSYEAFLVWPDVRLSVLSRFPCEQANSRFMGDQANNSSVHLDCEQPNNSSVHLDCEQPNNSSVYRISDEHPNPSSVYHISIDKEHLLWIIEYWDRSMTTWTSLIECPHPYEDHPHLINETKDDFVCVVSPHYDGQQADGCFVSTRTRHNFTSPKWLNKQCVTIGHNMEGYLRFPQAESEMQRFETNATCYSPSTFPTLYVDYFPHSFETYFPSRRPSPAVDPIPERAASFIARNCGSVMNERNDLVEYLQGEMAVYSIGNCLNNAEWPKNGGKYLEKVEALKHFALNLAFENQNSKDYVSEKVYDALQAGVIPVYLGAPNVDEYLPCKNCIIKVADFETREDLKNHLKEVLSNDTLLMSYQEWRTKPLEAEWLEKFDPILRRGFFCRIFHYLYGRRHGLDWDEANQTLVIK
eukprot:Selendium_serpulae@DN6350_c0_g1_i6.p1